MTLRLKFRAILLVVLTIITFYFITHFQRSNHWLAHTTSFFISHTEYENVTDSTGTDREKTRFKEPDIHYTKYHQTTTPIKSTSFYKPTATLNNDISNSNNVEEFSNLELLKIPSMIPPTDNETQSFGLSTPTRFVNELQNYNSAPKIIRNTTDGNQNKAIDESSPLINLKANSSSELIDEGETFVESGFEDTNDQDDILPITQNHKKSMEKIVFNNLSSNHTINVHTLSQPLPKIILESPHSLFKNITSILLEPKVTSDSEIIPLISKQIFNDNNDNDNDACPYKTSISLDEPNLISECQLYSTLFDPCKDASKYYNNETYKEVAKCTNKIYPPICRFVTARRLNNTTRSNLLCNAKICGNNAIEVGVIDENTGKMKHFSVKKLKSLTNVLSNTEADFAFLSCKRKKSKIHQLLTFPPKILTASPKPQKKLNINIVVLDSVSRQHFYRILPNTAETMRKLNIAPKNPMKILDFEAFQSLAPFTYVNLQSFLNGSVNFESVSNRRYELKGLFKKFKNIGYQTLLQEDTCWYDIWSSLLTGNKKLKSESKEYQQKLWYDITNLTLHHSIDSLGLTHMSCEVLSKYGETNLFHSDNLYCLNGKPLSVYFLEHLTRDLQQHSKLEEAVPLFSYTHINFAHESTGMRIKAVDKHIATFVQSLTTLENTLTIFWSDHGGKTNKYSIDTISGQFEVYDPFMFMLVPDSLKSIVGKKSYETLFKNQNSLVTTTDLHYTMLQLINNLSGGASSNEAIKENLFTKTLHERSNCQNLPSRKYALCKCIDKLSFPNASDQRYKEFLTWLAEFSIGQLNNKLTLQQNSLKKSHYCQRLIAHSLDNVVLRDNPTGNEYIFSVTTNKNANEVEKFNFHVFYNVKRDESYSMLKLNFWQRTSVYSKYAYCKDKHVSNELCVCEEESEVTGSQKYLKTYTQFKKNGVTEAIVNQTCLSLIRRTFDQVVSFEIVNICKDQKKLAFSTNFLSSWEVATNLPISTTIGGYSIMFLTSFYKIYASNEDINPIIEVLS